MKALEIYRNVFTILGTNNLAKQVHLFTTGLFPLMDHCQIKVKCEWSMRIIYNLDYCIFSDELLGVFEQFLIPLESNLRPILPGLVAGMVLFALLIND